MKLKKDLSNKAEVEKECRDKVNALLNKYNCIAVPSFTIKSGSIIPRVDIEIRPELLKNLKK